MKFILILTFGIKIGTAGFGGVGMQEFDSKQSCETAGEEWVQSLGSEYIKLAKYQCSEK